MDTLFDLNPTHNQHRWYLPVTEDLCVGAAGRRFMFGGVGLAAAISAMERTCDRPVIWATAHYLSFARPGSIVDLDVWVPVAGRLTSQATVIEHIDDSKIITVHAALGNRDDPISDQWVTMPNVPAPDACSPFQHWRNEPQGLNRQFEMRLAAGIPNDRPFQSGRGDGRLIFWVRSRAGHAADSLLLAVIADFVASAIAGAIGRNAGGNSLDNTIRYTRHEPSEWVLCDVQIESIHAGIVHGAMHLFAPSGTLVATASQSLILRLHDAETEGGAT